MSDLALAPQPAPTASTGFGGHTTVIRTQRGAITITPLRDGDRQTVEAVFEHLSARARRRRFGKIELQPSELALHASVGDGRHVLVERAGQRAAALAHLVQDDDDPRSAEVGLAVADEWQGVGIGTALARRLAADAGGAGITRVHALLDADNRASLALIRAATTIVSTRFEGANLTVVSAIDCRLAGDRAATHLPFTRRHT